MNARHLFGAFILAGLLTLGVHEAEAQAEASSFTLETSLRGGYFAPSGGGDLLPFFARHLSLNASELEEIWIGLEVGLRPAGHFEVVAGIEGRRASSTRTSQSDPGMSGEPFVQTTSLQISPTWYGGARIFLHPHANLETSAPRARSWNGFLSAGFGGGRHELEQSGRMMDTQTGAPLDGRFRERGNHRLGFVGVGAEWSILPRSRLVVEVQRTAAGANPGGDFADFERLDLGGSRLVLGWAQRW